MAGQAPFLPQDFAMGKRPQASGGFSEQNLPSANVGPTFSEQDLPNPQIMDFVKGTTETASDEAMAEAPKHLKTPEAIQGLLLKGKADAGDEGGFTDSLTASEKVALGLLAIMPLIGGAIGGGEEGALLGAGAAGSGLTAFGKVKFQDQQQAAKAEALRAKATDRADKIGRQKEFRTERRGQELSDLTRSERFKLDKEKRSRTEKMQKEWSDDKVVAKYREVLTSSEKLMAALDGETGLSDLVSIVMTHKSIDPGSVVRDSEVVMVREAQGILEEIKLMATGAKAKGKILGPQAKAEMKRLSKKFVQIHGNLMRERANHARARAEGFGIEPDRIVPASFFKSLDREAGGTGAGEAGGTGAGGTSSGLEPGKAPGKKGVSRIRRQRDANGNFVTE